MNCLLFCKRVVLLSLATASLVVWQACNSCNPVTLKTIDLSPTNFATGTSGVAGSIGFCFSAGNPPPSPFTPGDGQVLVGFDDFFSPAAIPSPVTMCELRFFAPAYSSM